MARCFNWNIDRVNLLAFTSRFDPEGSFIPDEQERAQVAARLHGKIEFTESCWRWTAALNLGYAHNTQGQRHFTSQLGHRQIYEAFVGSIPEGLQLDHLCRVKNCVNPDHLEPVTPLVNIRRKDFALNGGAPHPKTCANGHPWEGNRIPNGKWTRCKVCHANREAVRKEQERLEMANAS